jgi:putative SOS response-associated peptidase YedK
MCNLYQSRRSAAEIAAHFRAVLPVMRFNTPDDILPGYPGLVVREEHGERVLQQMVWGWPLRLKGMKPESKPKPVNNIADVQKPMWVRFARKPEWRCIIPVTEFAEGERRQRREDADLAQRERASDLWVGRAVAAERRMERRLFRCHDRQQRSGPGSA